MPGIAALKAEAFGHHRAGALDQAEHLYRAILAAEPDDADAMHFLGVIAHQRGDEDGAAALIGRALALKPGSAEARCNLGLVVEAMGDRPAAIAHYQAALALRPLYAEAHNNLGRVLGAMGRSAEAAGHFERALALKPDLAEAHNNLGNLLKDQGRLDEAVARYEAALALKPGMAELHRNLGLALQAQGGLARALACFEAALALAPERAASHYDLANGLRAAGRHADAAPSYMQALALEPGHADAQCNLGLALHAQGDFAGARDSFARAIALSPDHANAHVNLGMTRLLRGDFGGFVDYEWRWRGPELPPRGFAAPRWRGAPLAGARILLHAEQGFGDTLHFVRYAPLVAARGGAVVLEVPAALHRLLARLPGLEAVVARGDALPDFAWHCPLLSLPLACATELGTIPAPIPYLAADPELAHRWRRRLGARSGLRVGLVWAGRPTHPRDRERSLALAQLAPLGAVAGVALYALQTGPQAAAIAAAPDGPAITDLAPGLSDFAETAAAMAALDLVVTVDTAAAHLAGALGKPVWVMLPRVPDWRWLTEREDSPWYPTARLFRQSVAGEWGPVVARVAAALGALARGPAARGGMDADARVRRGLALKAEGRLDAAMAEYQAALALAPDHVDACNNLANALKARGHVAQAVPLYRRALAARPDFAEGHNNLGTALAALGRLDEAIGHYERALEVAPALAAAHSNLGNALKDLGRLDEAIRCYERALAAAPGHDAAGSNLLLCRNYRAEETETTLAAAHLAWGRAQAVPARGIAVAGRAAGRLRLGYVSPDFRAHSVAHFVLPLLAAHDRQRFEIFCYSDAGAPDAMTRRLADEAEHWIDIHGQSDAAAHERIVGDGIDILVDLAGHTADNRMRLFAQRPAPLQASWLGYPGSTGLATIDLRLSDAIADPPGEADRLCSETVIRLPHFLCYRPPDAAGPVVPPPLLQSGTVTFGSFNLLAKLTPQVLALWARLLRAAPDARLLLKTQPLENRSARERLRGLFAAAGVAPERIAIAAATAAHADHLAHYGQVDIALDPFPYNGTTTTCEALWMGVPVVTLRGARHAARVGASLLAAVGLGELAAATPDAYVDIALRLARDAERLAALRQGLRARMRAAPLCDGAGFARAFEAELELAWRQRAGQGRD